jgi:hypothetical protein
MARRKITELPTISDVDLSDSLPIAGVNLVGTDTTVKVLLGQIKDYIATAPTELAQQALDEIAALEVEVSEISGQSAIDAVATAADRSVVEDLAAEAEASATEAAFSVLASDYYPAATSNVPRGITSTSGLTAGSGGTDGTFDLTFSGGNFSVNPTGTFTVSGGALTSVSITGPGLYVGASPTAPTATFTNSTGLTGASVTLVPGFVVTSGNGYWTDHASDTTKIQHFRNVANVATISTDITLPKTQLSTFTDIWLEVVTPYGCTAGSVTAGSGGTDGTFALAFSGGNFASNPTGTFVVSGGVLTTVTLATRGRYVGASPVAPTLSFAASAGLTGAGCTLSTSLIATTANNYFLRPIRSDVTLTGGATQYRFRWAAPLANITGSYNVEILQYTGAIFSSQVNVRAADGVSQIGPGEVSQYSILWMQRNPSSGSDFPGAVNVWHLIEPPDKITLVASKATSSNAPQGFLPSILRPVQMTKVGPYTWEIRVYKPVDHYENGITDRCQTDYDFYFLFDMGAFQGDTYAPALNSHGCRRLDHEYRFAHHRFFDLISGIITDVGHVPSTYEAVAMSGDFNDTGNTTNYQLSGIGHGHLESVSWTLYGTTEDASTGNLPVQSADLKNYPINTTFYGKKIVSTGVYYDESPTGERLTQRTMVHTFESAATHTCKVTNVFDPTVGGLDAPWGVRDGGYAGMFPIRNATRLRPIKVDPATGAVTEYGAIANINLQDNAQYNITTPTWADENWNGLEMWDHRQVIGGQVARSRYVNNAGAGYTHWVGAVIDANRVARTAPMFYKCETWGNKGYDPWYSDVSTKLDLSTSVLTTSVAYLTVFGDLPE